MAGIVVLHAARDGASAREFALAFNGGFAGRLALGATSKSIRFGPRVVVVALWTRSAADEALAETFAEHLSGVGERSVLCVADSVALAPSLYALNVAARLAWGPPAPIQPVLDVAAKVLGDTLGRAPTATRR